MDREPEDETEAIATVNGLVETACDGEYGFHAAAGGVDDARLARLLRGYAEQRAAFARELRDEVRRLGGAPRKDGHMAAALHRGWINIKAVVTGKDEAAIVAECERGEEIAVRNYEEALDRTLPVETREVVERQYLQVREAHDHLQALKQGYRQKRRRGEAESPGQGEGAEAHWAPAPVPRSRSPVASGYGVSSCRRGSSRTIQSPLNTSFT
jgi:uncharacterized protein (TIGR02284 family)